MRFDRKLVALVLVISMMLGTVPVSAAELNAQYGEASYYDIAVLNYSRMIAMQNGVVPVKKDNGYYYLITLNGTVKSAGYVRIEALGGNYFAVTDLNWNQGVIDSNGEVIVAPASNVEVDHRNGIICVSQNSNVNYYNAADWTSATSSEYWSDNYNPVTPSGDNNVLYDGTNTVRVEQSTLYDGNGNPIANPEEYEAFYTNRPAFLKYGSSYSSGKIIYVKKDDQCGVIDLSGNVIVPLGTYDYIGELNPNGYIAVYSGSDSQIFSKTGNAVPVKSFTGKKVATEVYYRDLVFTTGDGNYGVMDIDEATLIPAEYKIIEGAKFEGYYYVVKGSTYPDRTVGLYDDNCNVVVTDTHKSITQLGNNFIVYDGNSYGMKDGAGAEILATSYEDINAYSTEFIELYDGTSWSVVNSNGEKILPDSTYRYNLFDKNWIGYSLDPRSAYLYDGYEDGVYPIVEATSANLTYFPHIFNGSTVVDTLPVKASNINSDGLFVYKDVSTGKYGFGSTKGNLPTPTGGGGGAPELYGGGDSMVGTYTNAELRGLITAANPSAGTVDIGGTSLTYSDGFNDTKLGSVVVGSYVHVYLDTAGKIAGYYISLSGAITAIHTGNGTVTVNGTKYYYHSSISAGEQIPSSVLGRQCSLYLDGDGKIVWWHVQGSVNATVDGYVTAVTSNAVELRDEWDSANTTTYQYASDFSGVMFGSQDVGRWTYDVRLDNEGKITDYRLHEDGIVVSASSNSITLTPEGGSSNVTYYYSSSFNGEKLTTGATGKRGNLDLNSNRQITYCSLHDYGTITAANSSNETVTIQHGSASGNVETSYSYANDFNGLKIGAEHIGQWINVNMDASGKILWYLIDLEDESNNQDTVEILSVTPTIIGRGETVNLEVTVRYNLTTVSTGIVYLGVNLNEPNGFHLEDNETVTTGSGTVTLNATVTTATGWDTAIYANLSDANHGEEWSPLATDRWNVGENIIASGSCGTNATWTFSSGTLTISGTGAMADYGYDNENRAPWYSYASSIKKAVIQNGITRIGSCAFDQCTNLADVSIPNTVTTIGNNSFQLCSSLTSISFPNSLKTIEHSVFFGSGLTSVTVPDSVTRIDNSAFSGCGGLISAKLGNGIRKIDEYLFTEDSKLTSLTIPKNVSEIAPNAFSYTGIKKFSVASGNTAFSAEDGVLYNAAKTSIVCYPPQGNVNYIIPKTVGTVDLSLFWKTGIETIRISSGTTVTNTETIPDTFGSTASGSLKLYFQGNVTDTSGWEFLNKTGEKISVTAEQWEYHEDEIALSDAVLYVPYYANTVSTIGDSSLKSPFYGTGLVDTGLEVAITGGAVTGAPLATGKTIFTVSSGAKTYTLSVTTRANDATTVTAETSAELVIEKTVSNMTTANVTDQVFQIEDKDETTEVKSNFEKFLDVYLDGVKLVGGKIEPDSTEQDAIKSVADVPDDWEYYAEEGSTKITVRAQTFQNKTAGTHTIAATFEKTVVDPDTQAVTREVITAAQNFAITTSGGGGNGGNGGGGGGGGSSTGTVQQPAVATKTPKLSYSVTNGVAALDSTSVTQMAASATEQKSDTLTLDLTNGGETVTAVSLPAGLMDQIAQLAASGENSVDSLAIVLTSGSLELDAETLSEIAQQAGGESISMALEEVSADQLSDGQKAALEELSAEKIISIEISCADKQITDFGGGRVNLSIPFTAAANKNARGYAVWHLADDGKTSRHSTGYADGKISFRTAHFSNYAVAYREPNLFTDVLDGLWYTNDVDHVAALGLMNGVGGARFAPNAALTRAMFAKIIYNAENGTAGAPSSFSDVPDGMWYTDAVNWAAQNRIVSGTGNSQYAPDREITREELVMMLYNYATYKGYDAKTDVELTRFSDSSSVSTWAETAMKWAVRNKLINGVGEKLLAGDKATRAQVAKVMAYFLEQYAR